MRDLDHSLGGYALNQTGPLVQRFRDLGGATPLVRGAFGGVNAAWHALHKKLAAARAPAVWRGLLCPSVSQAKGILELHMQRRLCFAMAGARLRLLHSKMHPLLYSADDGFQDKDHQARKEARHTGALSACTGSRRGHGGEGWGWSTGVYLSACAGIADAYVDALCRWGERLLYLAQASLVMCVVCVCACVKACTQRS